MSGIKRRTISVDENRLRDLENRARVASREGDMRRAAERLQQAAEARVGRLDRQLRGERDRQDRFEGRLDGFGRDLASFRRDNEQVLQRQRAELLAGLQGEASERRRAVARLEQALDDRTDALRGEIHAVSAAIAQKQGDDLAAAAQWVELARADIASVHDELRHEQFAPGELSGIRDAVRLAEVELAAGRPQSAIAGCQSAWLDVRALRDRVLQRQSAFDAAWAIADEARVRALALVDAHAQVELRLDGNEPFAIDVDHWTDGGLRALRERLEHLDPSARAQGELDVDGLLGLVDGCEQIERTELPQRVALGRRAVLASVERADLQAAFLGELENLGYHLVDSAWEGDDSRRANRLHLANANGEDLVIELGASEDLGLDVAVHFRDDSPSDVLRRQRLRPVQQVLQEFGHRAGEFKTEPGTENRNAPAVAFAPRAVRDSG